MADWDSLPSRRTNISAERLSRLSFPAATGSGESHGESTAVTWSAARSCATSCSTNLRGAGVSICSRARTSRNSWSSSISNLSANNRVAFVESALGSANPPVDNFWAAGAPMTAATAISSRAIDSTNFGAAAVDRARVSSTADLKSDFAQRPAKQPPLCGPRIRNRRPPRQARQHTGVQSLCHAPTSGVAGQPAGVPATAVGSPRAGTPEAWRRSIFVLRCRAAPLRRRGIGNDAVNRNAGAAVGLTVAVSSRAAGPGDDAYRAASAHGLLVDVLG